MGNRSPVLPLCEYPKLRGRCGASAPHEWRGINLCCKHFTEFMLAVEELVKIADRMQYETMLRALQGRHKERPDDSGK